MERKKRSGLFREHGFTLIETALVATLVGIMAIIAVPKIISTDKHAVYMAARQITADMRYARGLAISNADSYTVRFYPVTSGDPTSLYDSYAILNADGTSVKDMEIPDQVDLIIDNGLGEDWDIIFGDLGNATDIGGTAIDGVIMSLDADGSYTQDINVIGATGRVWRDGP